MLIGATIGLIFGLVLGFTLYLGLLRIPMRYLFSVTSWMILLLAAGMAAQAANYLEQAGMLPQLGSTIWNTSHILSEHSALGQLLHTLIGYMARPDGIQVVFYLGTLIIIGYLMKFFDNKVPAHITTQK
jgi:high-affinity iron transporter